jgi:stage IV sporulation protein FB
MLGNAGETELDLRFQIFGIPVRVHPIFWLGAAFIAWHPDRPAWTLIGVVCVFISILIHELGHALTFRYYGFRGEIVLYMLGGYATGGRLSTWRNILVSAAGPIAGFLLAAIAWGVLIALSIYSPATLSQGQSLQPTGYALSQLLFINIWWGILNLIPCIPLDGGHIMQSLVYRYLPRRADIKILWVSILSSGAVALWGAQQQKRFLMIMFGIMCAQHIMALNQRNRFR